MYREKWVADILGDRSVLQVALDVHMTTTGSSERSRETQERDVLALREVEATWTNHHACDFDDCVLELVRVTIKEAGYATIAETYSVVTEDGREWFSDCTKAEAEHFAASLPKHTNAMIVPPLTMPESAVDGAETSYSALPKWKRGVLEASMKAQNEEPRPPIVR